jgi:hypothetical protein
MFDKTVSNPPISFIISLLYLLSLVPRLCLFWFRYKGHKFARSRQHFNCYFIFWYFFLLTQQIYPLISILYVLCHWIFTIIHIIFQNRDFCFLCCFSRSFILFSSVAILSRIPFISYNCIIANFPTKTMIKQDLSLRNLENF